MKAKRIHDELRSQLSKKEEAFMIHIEDIMNDYASKDLSLLNALIEIMVALKKLK